MDVHIKFNLTVLLISLLVFLVNTLLLETDSESKHKLAGRIVAFIIGLNVVNILLLIIRIISF